MVATSSDLRSAPVGRAAKGGGVALGEAFVSMYPRVELKRTFCHPLVVTISGVTELRREADMPTAAGRRDFPTEVIITGGFGRTLFT